MDKSYLPLIFKIFLFSILVPNIFFLNVGDFRITLYRVVILILIVPLFYNFLKKSITCDYFILFFNFYILLSSILHEGFIEGLESGGILFIESFGSYLIGKKFIKNEIDYTNFVKLLYKLVLFLFLAAIPEFVLGKNIFQPNVLHDTSRFGLFRVYGPFDHPILFGTFCSSAVSLFFLIDTCKPIRRFLNFKMGMVAIISSSFSLSSGALFSIFVQLVLVSWRHFVKLRHNKWTLFVGLTVAIYILLDIFSNRSPLVVILHRLTFSPHTAYFRLAIWDWALDYNVYRNPWFGIGSAEWVRPDWMHSVSIDSFWLVIMVRYGIPALLFLSIGILLMFFSIKHSFRTGLVKNNICSAYIFSMIGLIIAGFTVHYWNQLYVWFFFLLGSGSWMIIDNRSIKKAEF